MFVTVNVARAAGALAVGSCGAYGEAFDFRSVDEARASAMSKCQGDTCRLVTITKRGCAAFAVDFVNPCGANGWGMGPRLGRSGGLGEQRITVLRNERRADQRQLAACSGLAADGNRLHPRNLTYSPRNLRVAARTSFARSSGPALRASGISRLIGRSAGSARSRPR